jgi:hypothetical protein
MLDVSLDEWASQIQPHILLVSPLAAVSEQSMCFI